MYNFFIKGCKNIVLRFNFKSISVTTLVPESIFLNIKLMIVPLAGPEIISVCKVSSEIFLCTAFCSIVFLKTVLKVRISSVIILSSSLSIILTL